MRPKRLMGVGGAVAICGLCFWLGSLWASWGVITYRVRRIHVSCHLDWPTYGLPLGEYWSVLSDLRTGHTTNAIEHLEMFLDNAVFDAMQRRPLLKGWRQEELDKGFRSVAKYRQQYPRQKLRPFSLPLDPLQSEQWNAEVKRAMAEQEEIDSFLRTFQPATSSSNLDAKHSGK